MDHRVNHYKPVKGIPNKFLYRHLGAALFRLFAVLLSGAAAHAGVNIHLELDYNSGGGSSYYLCFPMLSTNSSTSVPASTGYFVWSPSSTISSGAYGQLLPDGTAPFSGAGYGDYVSLISDITNLWTLVITNTTSSNIYHFAFSGFSSNSFPKVSMIFPTEGAVGVTNTPTYLWSGPTNDYSLYVQESDSFGFYQDAYLPATQTNWTSPTPLSLGSNYNFSVSYSRDGSSNVVASTPTNDLAQTVPGWSSTVAMNTYSSADFTVTNPPLPTIGEALNATNLVWATGGDTDWFVETTNTYDGVAAAQSGSVTGNQSSILSTTVTGPGTLMFYWSSIANDPNGGFSYEFDVDGGYMDSIFGDNDWLQYGPIAIPAGQHTVSWTVFANGDTDPTQAGFLDQVSFVLPFVPASPGMWTATGVVTNPPYLHTATLLPNGKVLLCGGSDNSGNASAAVEIYNRSTGTWNSTSAMENARYAHTATVLTNGTVLVAGGITNYAPQGLVQTVELFNPTNSTWTTTGPLNFPRYGHTATLLANGKVLVVGGLGTNGSNVNLTNIYPGEVYDPVSGTWTVTGPMHYGRDSHTATLLPSGKVLVAGGNSPQSLLVTGSAELFDSATGNWTLTATMLDPLAYHTATLLPNGQVLVAGGDSEIGFFFGNSYYAVKDAELYDPATESWAATGSLIGIHDHHTATLLANGLVLVAGTAVENYTTNSAELYDPSSGQWAMAAQMKYARNQHTATLLPNGEVLAAGGFGAGGLIATAELYDSVVKTMITLANPTTLSGGAFQFVWTNTPGSSNVVLVTTNLAGALSNWTVLGGVTEPSAGRFQFIDTQAAGNSKRFYRVRSP
jgi:N-acetylneuraminic acid mutarotase